MKRGNEGNARIWIKNGTRKKKEGRKAGDAHRGENNEEELKTMRRNGIKNV